MDYFRKLAFVNLIPLLFIISCSTTVKPAKLDPKSGSFPTQSKIPSNGVLVEKPFLERYKNLIFVYNDIGDLNLDKFITQSFKNMNVFNTVLTQYEMEQLIYSKNLQDKIISITRLSGIQKAHNNIGDFLVVKVRKSRVGNYDYELDFQVFDAQNGDLVLHIRNHAFAWTGLDEPLFYPMFNAVLEWATGKKITTEQNPDIFRN
jgi:hypothetical protein